MDCKHTSKDITQLPDSSIVCSCGETWKFPIIYIWHVENEEWFRDEQEIEYGSKTPKRPSESA